MSLPDILFRHHDFTTETPSVDTLHSPSPDMGILTSYDFSILGYSSPKPIRVYQRQKPARVDSAESILINV